jgi:putative beta-lysine N-acetyltransferase
MSGLFWGQTFFHKEGNDLNLTASTMRLEEENYFLELYLDPFNKRVRVDDYRGALPAVLEKAEEVVRTKQAEKLIMKTRAEDCMLLLERGMQPEAVVDRYFLGSDAYFFSKFYTVERKKNDHWITEDGIIHSIYELKASVGKNLPPLDYELELAELYRQVFPIYPTPLHDAEYVKKTMNEGTVYYVYSFNGEIVSAASAEINPLYKNAELTDCATLTEHRQYGLMKLILQELENELRRNGIYCAYSIARSLSFGMNAVLYQLGYKYRGRLMNNCFIYDKLENMNMWVKNLANC